MMMPRNKSVGDIKVNLDDIEANVDAGRADADSQEIQVDRLPPITSRSQRQREQQKNQSLSMARSIKSISRRDEDD